MFLPQFKKQIATFVCLSLSCSLAYPMDTQKKQTPKPTHNRARALATSSVSCSPCCDKNAGNTTPPARPPIVIEPVVDKPITTSPSNVDLRLPSSSFTQATFPEEDQKKQQALAQKPDYDAQIEQLAQQDSCLQTAVAKISGTMHKYKVNYFLGTLELVSACVALYNIGADTNPEPEWSRAVNTTAAVCCVNAGLAQLTAAAIEKLTKKNKPAVQAPAPVAQPSRSQRAYTFCRNNIGAIISVGGVAVAVANLSQPEGGHTPDVVNGFDAVVSLTGAAACGIAESLSTAKSRIEAQQKAERIRRHGVNDSVELDGRKITFSTPTTRISQGSNAPSNQSAEQSMTDLEV